MYSNGFELAIEVGGRRIPEYGHRGLTFIEGKRGYRYVIKFKNNRADRVLVVPSVDGLNAIDGSPHHDNSPGYVVQPYASLSISGWRTSLSEVRTFEFSDKGGSYAGKTQGQANCGVIGVKVWAEQQYTINLGQGYPVYPSSTIIHHWGPGERSLYSAEMMSKSCGPTGAPGAKGPEGPPGQLMMSSSPQYAANVMSSAAPDFNLGTKYGDAQADFVSQTTFNKSYLAATMEIYYSDSEGLTKDGVVLSKAPELAVYPQAFGGSFCKPPPY